MTDNRIIPIVMPKWGLSMKEGKVTSWLVEDGTTINPGDKILEVETDKIAGEVEATDAGILRRRVGQPDTMYPVKALIGVIADPSVPDAAIDDFIAAYVTPVAAEGEEDEGAKYEFAETPAGRLRYAKRGDGGQTILLVHGFGGDIDNWLFNIDALADKNTVYALDLPGHGQSTKQLADPSLKGLTTAVAGFMDHLGLGGAHLVGHSLGAAIALQMALDHPAKVESVALVCPAGLGPEFSSYVDDYVAANSRKELKPVLERLFADKSLVSRQLVDDVLKYKRLDGVETALKELASSLFAGQRQQNVLADKMAGRNVRALVIWGKDDQVIPSSQANNLAGAKVHVLDGAGHMVFMEKAADVNPLIQAHVAGG